MKKAYLLSTIIGILFISCSQQDKIEGFDEAKWRQDYNGCTNQRGELAKILLKNKEKLKKYDDDAITALLGDPERNRQFERGKKNYIYFLYPGKQCLGSALQKEGKKLVIEFDALGYPRIIRESQIDY